LGNKSNNIRIIWHPKLNKDIDDLISKSGLETLFEEKKIRNLNFLFRRGKVAIQQFNSLEKLKSCDLCSMKIKIKKNIRLLFKMHIEKEKTIFIFLHAFEEKSSKDYDKAIKIAGRRLQTKKGWENVRL